LEGKKKLEMLDIYKPGRCREDKKKNKTGLYFIAAKVEKGVWVRKFGMSIFHIIYFSTFKYPTKKSQDLFLEPDPFLCPVNNQSLRSYLK